MGTPVDHLQRIQSAEWATGDTARVLALSGGQSADFYAPWRRSARITGRVARKPDAGH